MVQIGENCICISNEDKKIKSLVDKFLVIKNIRRFRLDDVAIVGPGYQRNCQPLYVRVFIPKVKPDGSNGEDRDCYFYLKSLWGSDCDGEMPINEEKVCTSDFFKERVSENTDYSSNGQYQGISEYTSWYGIDSRGIQKAPGIFRLRFCPITEKKYLNTMKALEHKLSEYLTLIEKLKEGKINHNFLKKRAFEILKRDESFMNPILNKLRNCKTYIDALKASEGNLEQISPEIQAFQRRLPIIIFLYSNTYKKQV